MKLKHVYAIWVNDSTSKIKTLLKNIYIFLKLKKRKLM